MIASSVTAVWEAGLNVSIKWCFVSTWESLIFATSLMLIFSKPSSFICLTSMSVALALSFWVAPLRALPFPGFKSTGYFIVWWQKINRNNVSPIFVLMIEILMIEISILTRKGKLTLWQRFTYGLIFLGRKCKYDVTKARSFARNFVSRELSFIFTRWRFL